MFGVTGRHHIIGIEHLYGNIGAVFVTLNRCYTRSYDVSNTGTDLLGDLGYRQRSVVFASPGGERRESGDEKVQPREWNHIHGEFT